MKEFAHAFSCAYIALWMHLGSLESKKKLELLSAAPRATRALQTFRVHPWLDVRTLSMNKFLMHKEKFNYHK